MNPSEEEFTLLKAYSKTSPLILIRSKSQAILMRCKELSLNDIADILSHDEKTVGRWIKDFSTLVLYLILSLKDPSLRIAFIQDDRNERSKLTGY